MVYRLKSLVKEGKKVKIVTARVAPRLEAGKEYGEQFVVGSDGVRIYAHSFVENWCAANLGFVPEIVYKKDHLMVELYDDRVKQVVQNEGLLVEELNNVECEKMMEALEIAHDVLARAHCDKDPLPTDEIVRVLHVIESALSSTDINGVEQ